MESDIDPAEEFLLMGTYSIVDARKLLSGLDSAEIEYRVEFNDGVANIGPLQAESGGAFGQAAQATVSVAAAQKQQADRIHTDLFGDCLPNYDSTFFDNPDNVSDEQG
jgi:hypothetical protein